MIIPADEITFLLQDLFKDGLAVSPKSILRHAAQRRSREIGFYLFIASLAMFFAALLIAYIVKKQFLDLQSTRLPSLPWLLVPSTICLFAGSTMLQRALRMVRREKQPEFISSLRISLGLAIGFCGLQVIALAQMLRNIWQNQPELLSYPLIFMMVLMHIFHFLAGVIHLSLVTRWAGQGQFDHESYQQVYFAVWYWRFLDAIWVLMLIVFFLG